MGTVKTQYPFDIKDKFEEIKALVFLIFVVFIIFSFAPKCENPSYIPTTSFDISINFLIAFEGYLFFL